MPCWEHTAGGCGDKLSGLNRSTALLASRNGGGAGVTSSQETATTI